MWRVAVRLARSELRSRPFRAAVAALMIAAASALAILALGLNAATGDAYRRVADEAGGAHAWVFTRDPSLAASAATLPEVAVATPAFPRTRGTIAAGAAPFPVMFWAMPQAIPSPAPSVLRSGRWLSGGANDIVIDEAVSRRLGLRAGDTVDAVAQGGTRRLTIVGVGINTTQAPYPLDRPADVFVAPTTVQALAGGAFESSAFGVRLKNPDQAPQLLRAASTVARGRAFATTWLSISSQIEKSNLPATILLQTFSAFAFLSVGFVLANSVAAQLLGKSREIGLLRAAGLSPRQVTAVVAGEYVLFALVASAAGAALGVVLTPFASTRVASALTSTPPASFDPARFALVVGIAVVATAAFVLVPARAAGRGTVSAALSGRRSPRRSRASVLGRFAAALRLPTSARLGLKDAFARPGRAWVTIGAIALAAATVAMSLTLEATGRAIESDPSVIGRPPFQLRLTPRQVPGGTAFAGVVDGVRSVPGVAAVTVEHGSTGYLEGTGVFPVVGLAGDMAKMPFNILEGGPVRATGDALVGTTLARENGIVPGQQLVILTSNRTTTYNVTGIVPDDDSDGRIVYYKESDDLRGNGTVDVLLNRSESTGAAAKAIEAKFPAGFAIEDLDANFRDDLRQQQSALRTIMVALNLALIGVGLANLFGVLVLTIRERTRELGILRAIGVTRAQIFGAVAVSSGLYTITGLAAGAPMGYFVTARLFDHFGGASGWPSGIARVPPTSWTALALLAGFSIVAGFTVIPARQATALTVSDALREE